MLCKIKIDVGTQTHPATLADALDRLSKDLRSGGPLYVGKKLTVYDINHPDEPKAGSLKIKES